MSALIGAVIGGLIALLSSLAVTFLASKVESDRKAKSIRVIARAEISAVQSQFQRFLDGHTAAASMEPIVAGIAGEIGFLSPEQAVKYREAITLANEFRNDPSTERARRTVSACEAALKELGE